MGVNGVVKWVLIGWLIWVVNRVVDLVLNWIDRCLIG